MAPSSWMHTKQKWAPGDKWLRPGPHGTVQPNIHRPQLPAYSFAGRPGALVRVHQAALPVSPGSPVDPFDTTTSPGSTPTGYPARYMTHTPGLTIPIESVLSTQVQPKKEVLKAFTSSAGNIRTRRCPRLHLMYKTPEQVLREMDEEKDRLVLMAEITDLIERKKCKLKEKKKKRMAKSADKRPKPCWYQELTTTQMNTVEMLGSALMADMEEGIMDRTVVLVNRLRLKPAPNTHVLWHVMVNCFTSPVLFLLYLAKCLEPRRRPRNKDHECMYAVRERILLSAVVHLLMPRTLFDLHFILPQPKILNKRQKKAPVAFKLRRKYYVSPYCEPQSIFVQQRLDEAEKNKYELVERLEQSKKFHVPTNDEFKENCTVQLFGDVTDYVEQLNDFTQAVKRQHKVLAKRSRVFLPRHYGNENDEENSFYRQVSYLPTLEPQFPNQTYSFLRYSTSTEPPVTDILPQIQENQDHEGFEPMMSFRQCLYTWDDYPLSELCGSHIPPLTDIHVSQRTTMLQLMALEGYWHAYPRPAYCRQKKCEACTDQDPYSCPDYVEYLKHSMAYLASKGNPLATLPDAYLLPHIQKWILKRNRFEITRKKKNELLRVSDYAFERGRYKMKLQRLPWIKLPLEKLHNLTWDSRCLMGRLVKKEKEKFYGRLQTWMVNDSRKFWDIMFMKYHDAPFFRDAFYAYCPSTQSDVKFPCKIVRK